MQCISFHAGLKSFLPKATVEDLEKYDGELRVSLTSVHLDWWKTREIVVVGHTSIPARMSIRRETVSGKYHGQTGTARILNVYPENSRTL